jgi:acetylornithine aminotransferase
MVAKEKLREGFTAGSHGSTFGGTPIATAVVKATLETMVEEDVPAKAAEAGEYLMRRLREALSGVLFVQDVRGLGLLVGIQCAGPVSSVLAEAQAKGLLVLSAGPNVVRLLPNLLVTKDEIEEAVAILAELLKAVQV